MVQAVEPDVGQSKFCGSAHLVNGELPPACKLCGRDLQLFVQLDLDDLPEGAQDQFGHGVLQLFYCVGPDPGEAEDGRPECWAEGAWAAFSDEASLARIVARSALASVPVGGRAAFPALAIVGWERVDDLPNAVDQAGAGLVSSYDFEQRTVKLQCAQVGLEATLGIDELPVEDITSSLDKDKLSGWPFWVQGSEYPKCPTCGDRMRLVIQLDSEDHVPYMFGDAGVGHVTQCAKHLDVVAFGWACS